MPGAQIRHEDEYCGDDDDDDDHDSCGDVDGDVDDDVYGNDSVFDEKV